MNRYIKKYIDWVKANLGNTLVIMGFLLIAIPSIYVAASVNIIFGMLACGFFTMIAGILIY